jgi:hypothetical protein
MLTTKTSFYNGAIIRTLSIKKKKNSENKTFTDGTKCLQKQKLQSFPYSMHNRNTEFYSDMSLSISTQVFHVTFNSIRS